MRNFANLVVDGYWLVIFWHLSVLLEADLRVLKFIMSFCSWAIFLLGNSHLKASRLE